jgi:hypothetical protein
MCQVPPTPKQPEAYISWSLAGDLGKPPASLWNPAGILRVRVGCHSRKKGIRNPVKYAHWGMGSWV